MIIPEKIISNLRVSPDHAKELINAPDWFRDGFYTLFEEQPSQELLDFILLFAEDSKTLGKLLKSNHHLGKYDCIFWVCYPKLTGEIKSDLKREVVFDMVSKFDLRPVTQISINHTWSALRIRPIQAVGK